MKQGDFFTNIKVDVNLVRQMRFVEVLTGIKGLAFFLPKPMTFRKLVDKVQKVEALQVSMTKILVDKSFLMFRSFLSHVVI